MAFSDPQSVTVGGTAISLPRTNAGEFTAADGMNDLTFTHQVGARRTNRRARFHTTKIAADPYAANVNIPVDMSVALLVNVGKQGYTIAEQLAVVKGFLANLSATSDANLLKLLGGEN